MDGSVCGILTVVFLVTLRYLAWRSGKDQLVEAAPAWIDFARRHELRFNELNIWGSFKGYALHVHTEPRRTGRITVNLTHLSLAVPALPRTVVLKPGGGFDGRSILHANATPEVAELFRHPAVRERFSAAANTYREFLIQDGNITALRNGLVPATMEEMEDFIEPAFRLARALDEAARSGAAPLRSG